MSKVLIAILSIVLTLDIVAVAAHLPHADAAWVSLGIFGLAAVAYFLWSVFCFYFDRTNGNDTGLIVFMVDGAAMAFVGVVAPLLVVFLGHAWLIFGATALFTAILTGIACYLMT